MQSSEDRRLDFPATGRNQDAILRVLQDSLSGTPKDILEVASGSGQHAVHLAAAFSNVTWWPSDIAAEHLQSIDSWVASAAARSVKPAVFLDVTTQDWRRGAVIPDLPVAFDGIVNINMIHISPWQAAQGLVEGAAKRIRSGGFLYFYGPFKRDGVHTAPSNARFDEYLRRDNPDWGVRDVAEVEEIAVAQGFRLQSVTEMPANNLSLIFGYRVGP